MNNIFLYIALAGYVLSAICLFTAVILFFKFRIPYVIKDLNGTIAEQEIGALRKRTIQNKNNRVKMYDPDKDSARLTEKSGVREVSEAREKPALAMEEDTEMRTSILAFNKVISRDFVITTDIVFINTEERI